MKSEKKIVVFRIIGRKEKMLLIFPDLYLILKKSCNISFLSLRAWDESNQVILSITKVDEVLVLFAYAGDPRHNEMMFCSGEEFCIFTRNFLTLFLLFVPGSFHLSFFVTFGDKVTKISCHFQTKTVQLIFSFFVNDEKRKKTAVLSLPENDSWFW